jgi:Tol biopolymer transport system component
MGEVWRARDTRLDRSVAIKILPAEFSENARLKARFEREAKAISQLNHPNICSLFDVGHHDGTDFLVMELIEGQTLADLLRRGPLPLASVIRYGAEIAEALETAHRSRVVHRDLKPQNVMITRSGAKLLDFGLAKPNVIEVGVDAATAQKSLTGEGMIVGTLHYMSPEQLEGQDVDHRSDIFALGAVLYEMATGRRAFGGQTRTSVIAAIVAAEPPPMSQLQPLTPRALERLVRACLSKDPDARVQSAHDVAMELRWIAESPESVSPTAKRGWLPWAIAALLALMLAGGATWHFRPRPAAQPVRFEIAAPRGTNIEGVPAISPDGRQIVFRTVGADREWRLWLRPIDSLEATPLKGSEGAIFAFWSPDGRSIGFIARNKMWRLDLGDGNVRMIYEPIEYPPGGATWNRDGVIVFAPRSEAGLLRVSAAGGVAAPVASTTKQPVSLFPWFLPDGDHFLYRADRNPVGPPGIWAAALSGGAPKLIVSRIGQDLSRPAYAAGHLFYEQGVALYAQPFDPAKLELSGEPVKIDDDVEYPSPWRAAFSVSESGTVAYRKTGSPMVTQLTLVDRAGRKVGSIGELTPIVRFELSNDERQILFVRGGDNPSVWVLDTVRGTTSRAAFEDWTNSPVWMPDSRTFAYAVAVDGPPNAYLRRPGGAIERLTTSNEQHYPTSASPDGRYVICDFNDPKTGTDVYAVPVAAPHTPVAVAKSRFHELDGAVSPDGRWLAFTSDESGTNQIYATPFPGGGARVQISNAGGVNARWSRDGRQLYFVQPDKRLMAVEMAVVDGEPRPSVPEPLFILQSAFFDVTRDGRFLVPEYQLNPDAPGLTVVVGWSGAR